MRTVEGFPAHWPAVGRTAINLSESRQLVRRGVEQWQLVGLITRRSQVRILSPLPMCVWLA